MAVAGETTLSIGHAIKGNSNRYASICHAIDTSSGSRVLRAGTMPISSSEYARRPLLPRPISMSVTRSPRPSADLLARSLLPAAIVRRLDRHLHVVRMTFRQAGGRDLDEPGFLQIADG